MNNKKKIFLVVSIGIVSIILLLLVLTPLGIKANGARRWLGFGAFTIQPSEIAKFAVILLFANMIEKNYDKMKTITYGIMPFATVLGSIVVLMFFQPHLSGIVIICMVGAIMMFIGGTKLLPLILPMRVRVWEDW